MHSSGPIARVYAATHTKVFFDGGIIFQLGLIAASTATNDRDILEASISWDAIDWKLEPIPTPG